jgi:hypothetical protein
MSMEEECAAPVDYFRCPHCGKDFDKHLGVIGQCARIQRLESELAALRDARPWETPKAFSLRMGRCPTWLSTMLKRGRVAVPIEDCDRSRDGRLIRLRSSPELELRCRAFGTQKAPAHS